MSLVPSLLRAIVLVDGDALVLHAGAQPYVTSAAGQIDLPGNDMSSDAVSDVIAQLLPPDSQQALTTHGAAQCDITGLTDFPGERFQVVATNAAGALAVEIRRGDRLRTPELVEPQATSAGRRQSDRQEPARTMPPADTAAPPEPRPPTVVVPPSLPRGGDLLERLMHKAFADGASMVYLAAGAAPWVRIDDELHIMKGTPPLSAAEIDVMLARAPGGSATDARQPEWLWDLPELGRVRCTSFQDSRGRGIVLRSVPSRPLTTRQLGLSREIEALTTHTSGLVIVAAARGSAARTLVAALVDLINRTRRVHVIAIEQEVAVVHDCEASLISQREAGRSPSRMLELSREALREEPDVIVFDAVSGAEQMSMALDAAQSGRLVICGVRGSSVQTVVADIVALFPPEERHAVQRSLSRALVGVVAESGDTAGQPFASHRQSLINSPETAALIADGRFGELGPTNRRR